MTLKTATLAASLTLLSAVSAFAQADAAFTAALRTVSFAAADGHYKLVERRAKAALDGLKDLHGYADQINDGGEGLRKEMQESRYEDWINTRLLPALFDARSAAETVKKTYELEKKNVENALKAAKAGDFAAADAAIARIASFETDYESREKAVEARIAEVRKGYEHDFGNARTAFAQFDSLPLVQELLAAKPQLIKAIDLVPVSLRPLQWSVVVTKQLKDSNDPRFAALPKSIAIKDGAETLPYPVVVR